MTDREKKLLFFLLGALFIIGNFVAFAQFYAPAKQAAEAETLQAQTQLKQHQQVLKQQALFEPEMRWLEGTGDKVTTQGEAQSQLQSDVSRQALSRSLEVRREDIMEAIPGTHYDRVRVQFKVTGTEENIRRWITAIHAPRRRQVITKLSMKPQNNDLTRVEVDVEVEKWIITERNLEMTGETTTASL